DQERQRPLRQFEPDLGRPAGAAGAAQAGGLGVEALQGTPSPDSHRRLVDVKIHVVTPRPFLRRGRSGGGRVARPPAVGGWAGESGLSNGRLITGLIRKFDASSFSKISPCVLPGREPLRGSQEVKERHAVARGEVFVSPRLYVDTCARVLVVAVEGTAL